MYYKLEYKMKFFVFFTCKKYALFNSLTDVINFITTNKVYSFRIWEITNENKRLIDSIQLLY
jgi:hypothetical protein